MGAQRTQDDAAFHAAQASFSRAGSAVPEMRSNPAKSGSFADLFARAETEAQAEASEREVSTAAFRAGSLVRSIRREAGLSQAQLARQIGVTQARISEIEAGLGRHGPSWDVMDRIAAACGREIGILPNEHEQEARMAAESF